VYLEKYIQKMRPAIENELQKVTTDFLPAQYPELRGMLAYHMGWEGEGAGIEAQGKRIRPLLVLLSAEAAGGDWQQALPVSAAVELIHNFSLIHDDIQDQSPLRHGRSTVWVKWGTAQAINAGDVMFTLAHLTIFQLAQFLPAEAALRAAKLLDETCIKLTEGQYLDMSYQSHSQLPLEAYWPMVAGKTAALLGCSTELGALSAGANQTTCNAFHQFGVSLGMAFQVLDDWLGIWGNAALTGKSTESDLVSRKKTLPVLFGLNQKGRFASRWVEDKAIQPAEVPLLAGYLEQEGAKAYTQETADRLTQEARAALGEAAKENEALLALQELSNQLLKRKY
jgi:geranylgeranyl diphosphate synthase, type I